MPNRFIVMIKYLAMSLLAFVVLGTFNPARADEPITHAQFVSDDAYMFVTIQDDDEHVQALNVLIEQLENNFHNQFPIPRVESSIITIMEIIGLESYLSRHLQINPDWVGDQFSIAIQPTNLTRSYSDVDVLAILDIRDPDVFLENIRPEAVIEQAGEYTLIDNMILVVGNTLIYTDTTNLDELIEKIENQAPLSDSAKYQEGLAFFSGDNYPITGYLNTRALIIELMNSSRNYNASVQLPNSDWLSDFVFGVHYPDDRTIALDAFQPDLRINTDDLDAINRNFAENFPTTIHLASHGYQAEFLFDLAIEALNQTSSAIEENKVDGYQMFNVGGLFKQALITTIAGFTGLNLERDIIEEIDEDYAFIARFIPETVMAEFGFLAHMSDQEDVDYIFDSLTEASQRYGVDLTIQERHLHAPNLLPQLLTLFEGSTFRPNPSLELSLIHRDNVLAFGSTPLVNAVIGRDGTLGQESIYQDAFNRHPNDVIKMLYFNLPIIAQDIVKINPSMIGARPEELLQYQFMLAQAESLVFSTAIQDETLVHRLTVTLAEEVPYPLPE